jgi:hypothetical protein
VFGLRFLGHIYGRALFQLNQGLLVGRPALHLTAAGAVLLILSFGVTYSNRLDINPKLGFNGVPNGNSIRLGRNLEGVGINGGSLLGSLLGYEMLNKNVFSMDHYWFPPLIRSKRRAIPFSLKIIDPYWQSS